MSQAETDKLSISLFAHYFASQLIFAYRTNHPKMQKLDLSKNGLQQTWWLIIMFRTRIDHLATTPIISDKLNGVLKKPRPDSFKAHCRYPQGIYTVLSTLTWRKSKRKVAGHWTSTNSRNIRYPYHIISTLIVRLNHLGERERETRETRER